MESQLRTAFGEKFGGAPAVVSFAPGRVNLIGEHTDYNDGFALPCALDVGTWVAIRPVSGHAVSALALDYEQVDSFTIGTPYEPSVEAPWSNYVRGVYAALSEAGYRPGAVELAVVGNVPQGAGLSSSASLEIALLVALNAVFQLGLSPVDWAVLGQRAENDYVGCRCGIMDQLTSATATPGHASLLDCRSLEVRPVSMPENLSITIVDSKVERQLVESEYNDRRADCEAAARLLEITSLRDIELERLLERRSVLPPLVYRRAHHVVTENARTLSAADALVHGRLSLLGELLSASHRSLRDDYEVTVPATDTLFELINAVINGAGGVRMTGGGFGGCLVALTPPHLVPLIESAVTENYARLTGLTAEIHRCRPGRGAHLLR